ncbi:MAG: GNAT family N-acetyltransferase [Candidatus Omnitrophica bacterium]|nr:GNAT family N-acetyltransferase [Candidatus Omnitrophota bacterium]
MRPIGPSESDVANQLTLQLQAGLEEVKPEPLTERLFEDKRLQLENLLEATVDIPVYTRRVLEPKGGLLIREVRDPRFSFVARDKAGEIIALVTGFPTGEFDEPSNAVRISWLAVKKDNQRHHVGARLLEAVRRAAGEAGFGTVTWEVLQRNAEGIAFYESQGAVRKESVPSILGRDNAFRYEIDALAPAAGLEEIPEQARPLVEALFAPDGNHGMALQELDEWMATYAPEGAPELAVFIPPLARVLREDPDLLVRNLAASILGFGIRHPQILDIFTERLRGNPPAVEREPDANVRLTLIQELTHLNFENAQQIGNAIQILRQIRDDATETVQNRQLAGQLREHLRPVYETARTMENPNASVAQRREASKRFFELVSFPSAYWHAEDWSHVEWEHYNWLLRQSLRRAVELESRRRDHTRDPEFVLGLAGFLVQRIEEAQTDAHSDYLPVLQRERAAVRSLLVDIRDRFSRRSVMPDRIPIVLRGLINRMADIQQAAGLEEGPRIPVTHNVHGQLLNLVRATAVDRNPRYYLLFGREGRILQAANVPVELTGLAFPGHLRDVPGIIAFIQQTAASQSPPLQLMGDFTTRTYPVHDISLISHTPATRRLWLTFFSRIYWAIRDAQSLPEPGEAAALVDGDFQWFREIYPVLQENAGTQIAQPFLRMVGLQEPRGTVLRAFHIQSAQIPPGTRQTRFIRSNAVVGPTTYYTRDLERGGLAREFQVQPTGPASAWPGPLRPEQLFAAFQFLTYRMTPPFNPPWDESATLGRDLNYDWAVFSDGISQEDMIYLIFGAYGDAAEMAPTFAANPQARRAFRAMRPLLLEIDQYWRETGTFNVDQIAANLQMATAALNLSEAEARALTERTLEVLGVSPSAGLEETDLEEMRQLLETVLDRDGAVQKRLEALRALNDRHFRSAIERNDIQVVAEFVPLLREILLLTQDRVVQESERDNPAEYHSSAELRDQAALGLDRVDAVMNSPRFKNAIFESFVLALRGEPDSEVRRRLVQRLRLFRYDSPERLGRAIEIFEQMAQEDPSITVREEAANVVARWRPLCDFYQRVVSDPQLGIFRKTATNVLLEAVRSRDELPVSEFYPEKVLAILGRMASFSQTKAVDDAERVALGDLISRVAREFQQPDPRWALPIRFRQAINLMLNQISYNPAALMEGGPRVLTIQQLADRGVELAAQAQARGYANVVLVPAGEPVRPMAPAGALFAHSSVSGAAWSLLPEGWISPDNIFEIDANNPSDAITRAVERFETDSAVVIALDEKLPVDLRPFDKRPATLLLNPENWYNLMTDEYRSVLATILSQPRSFTNLILDLTSGSIQRVTIEGKDYFAIFA